MSTTWSTVWRAGAYGWSGDVRIHAPGDCDWFAHRVSHALHSVVSCDPCAWRVSLVVLEIWPHRAAHPAGGRELSFILEARSAFVRRRISLLRRRRRHWTR